MLHDVRGQIARVMARRDGPSSLYEELDSQETNSLVPIYRRTIPGGVCAKFDPYGTFRCQLAFLETIEAPGDNSAQAVTGDIHEVLDHSGAAKIAREAQVWLTADGTARTVTAVAEYPTSPGTVTCSDETNADHEYAYIRRGGGDIVVVVEMPRGPSKLLYEVFRRSANSVMSMEQDRHLGITCPFWIPEDWKIGVYANLSYAISYTATFGDASTAEITINRIDLPLIFGPRAEFDYDVEENAKRIMTAATR